MAEVREAAAAETARAEECVAAAASEEKLAEAGAAEAGAAEAEAWVEAEVARQEAATATAEVQVLVRRAAALQAQLAGTLAGTQAERRARAQQLSASAMHAASLTSQVEALEAELGRTEERGRAVVHARDDARREAAEAAHACAQLTQRAWAVAPRLLRLLPPPAEAALSGVLVAPSAAMAPWGALEGALGRAEEEGGWRTEAEAARAAEARRAAQKASTSLQGTTRDLTVLRDVMSSVIVSLLKHSGRWALGWQFDGAVEYSLSLRSALSLLTPSLARSTSHTLPLSLPQPPL